MNLAHTCVEFRFQHALKNNKQGLQKPLPFSFFTLNQLFMEGIFRGIGKVGGLVVGDICHAQIAEHFEDGLAIVSEGQFGIIKATIYQHPYRQGFSAVNKAFEYLVHGRLPEKEECILKNEIKLVENL